MKDDIERLQVRVNKAFALRQKCMQDMMKYTSENDSLYIKKINALNEKYYLLNEKLDYLKSEFIASDNEIEIKRFGNNVCNRYNIYIKGKGLKVGYIDYRGYHNSIVLGDIGYVIDYRYRGNNYAYKALCLLSNYLYENNIPDFYISVFHDNIPSIKTIRKYGGGMIIKKDNMITTYQCETREKERVFK